MTTGTNPDPRAAARRWAAELLGVPETTSSEEARRAYFTKVRESDFLPPYSLYHALRILDGKGVAADPDEEWYLKEEDKLRAEVEALAAEFFTVPVPQRRERWEMLLSRCADVPSLCARLQALEPGLEVEVQVVPGESFYAPLAEQLLRAFPLPPLAQATSRQAFVRKIEQPSAAAHRKSWEKAARYVLAEWPALAALDQEFVQHIAKLRRHLKRRSKMHARNQRARKAASAGRGKSKRPWLFFVSFLVVSAILRGMVASNHSSSWQSPTPKYSAPRGGRRVPDLEELRRRMVPDPNNGAETLEDFFNLPPIHELIDPSKFDVEVDNAMGPRIFRFTPRPGLIIKRNSPLANYGQPVLVVEAILSLRGVTQEQMKVLLARAAGGKRTGSARKVPPEGVGPNPPKKPPVDKTRS